MSNWNWNMDSVPKDGRLLNLLAIGVDTLQELPGVTSQWEVTQPTHDTNGVFRTMGQNSFNHTKRDIWEVVGWDNESYAWVSTVAVPVAWAELPPLPGEV